jgi:hypothetical protein
MISAAEVSLVSKKVAIGGGTDFEISAIRSSEITPGPLGIRATNPKADAPYSMAVLASDNEEIQQIFMCGNFMEFELNIFYSNIRFLFQTFTIIMIIIKF